MSSTVCGRKSDFISSFSPRGGRVSVFRWGKNVESAGKITSKMWFYRLESGLLGIIIGSSWI
jgi:hypothetical protein